MEARTKPRMTELLTLRMLGEPFTLRRCQWAELLDELRADSPLAGRIRELIACDHVWGAERDHPELGVYQRCERCGDYQVVEPDAGIVEAANAVKRAIAFLGLDAAHA